MIPNPYWRNHCWFFHDETGDEYGPFLFRWTAWWNFQRYCAFEFESKRTWFHQAAYIFKFERLFYRECGECKGNGGWKDYFGEWAACGCCDGRGVLGRLQWRLHKWQAWRERRAYERYERSQQMMCPHGFKDWDECPLCCH